MDESIFITKYIWKATKKSYQKGKIDAWNGNFFSK